MAETQQELVRSLTEDDSPGPDDIIYSVKTPDSAPLDRKVKNRYLIAGTVAGVSLQSSAPGADDAFPVLISGVLKRIKYSLMQTLFTPERLIQLKIMDDGTALTVGDGKLIFCIPLLLNGYNLTHADAYVTTVSSSGLPNVQIRNVTKGSDMLSTPITIDVSENTSYTAATPSVVDTNHDDVATGNLIAIDIDTAGTGAKGLGILLRFALP